MNPQASLKLSQASLKLAEAQDHAYRLSVLTGCQYTIETDIDSKSYWIVRFVEPMTQAATITKTLDSIKLLYRVAKEAQLTEFRKHEGRR